jgi:hypothetical protein
MLLDIVARVDAKGEPFLRMAGQGTPPINTLVEWQMDDFEDANDLATEDGEDVSTFSNASENRFRAQTYIQKFRDSAMVSDLADAVSDVAGLSTGEQAESIMKKLKRLSRSIEAACCSDQEHQAGAAGVPYKLRGLGTWIQSTQQALLPINANYLTPAASIDSTAMASLTPAIIGDIAESIYTKSGTIDDLDVICGPRLKRTIGGLLGYQPASTNVQSSIRAYTTQFAGVIDNVVDQFNSDFGNLRLHPDLWCAHPNLGGSTAAQLRRGYILKMKLVKLHWWRKPRVKPLEDKGGGPRFFVDAGCALVVQNPLGAGKFAATT